ncbi:Frag1/DRAM/Sfk1 family-domain-containing protein [Thelephora terrestris]|uniref:Frag1/DRAM/Sfk1 family-domain-containing protein n=1 Tax=Thelephora terrestris TaxID=56493 RepID=A0A9P6HPN2_9AGAM|nr:Frag1/DRAM/Sfk1 family-domain-containing protein [Thelephora terrestris]
MPDNVNQRSSTISFPASWVATAHTTLASLAFLIALAVGTGLHYKKLVKNGVAGYPQEWFPSVSATIGDWFPERSFFQIFIALTSGPRFALVFLQYYLQSQTRKSSWPFTLLIVGVIRSLSCGGWVFITSNDHHDAHDVLMISYIVCNVPWMFGSISYTPSMRMITKRQRKYVATAFFACIVPFVYFFIQHKVHKKPGAYTKSSLFEWGLIFLDITFDSILARDLRESGIRLFITQDKAMAEADGVTSPSHSPKVNATAPVARSKQHIHLPSFLSDLYLSYIFWSVFTSLAPTLFYFSIWKLAIAGPEASLLCTLSPILLGIPSIRLFLTSRRGRLASHLLSLLGLAAYRFDDPLHRLLLVNIANIFACALAAVEWSGDDSFYRGIILGLSFIISSVAKLANHSNNPVWPFMNENTGGYNKTGLSLALLAIVELSLRSPSEVLTPIRKGAVSKSWVTSGLALGSLIFALHNLLADSTTLITWSWTGYPVQGPVPHLHGYLTILAQCLGLAIPVLLPSAWVGILRHPLWFAYGSASVYFMYNCRDWVGYFGGLNVAVFSMSVLPMVLSMTAESANGRLARTYTLAFFVTCLLYLASVWTVAYAFVPGGVYLRERTDLVLLAQMALLSPAFTFSPPLAAVNQFFAADMRSKYWHHVRTTIFFTIVTSLLVTIYRLPPPPTLLKSSRRIVNAGIWTIHFGFDNAGRDSQRRMRDLIRDMDLDILGLLETDLQRVVYGHRDITRVMVEEMGYYADVGPGPNSHTWGAVLLSKFPIINSTHHLLPSPDGELAPAIEATINMYGTEVVVIVAHNGQEETPLDRELQSKELARIMAASFPKPVIYLGYVVTDPHAPRPAPYKIITEDGKVFDIDMDDTDRWCEYIFFRGLYRTAYVRVSRDTITDTELQIGQFVVPEGGVVVANHTVEALYPRIARESLPEEHWFPDTYCGQGQRGHRYHVFDEPLYYRIP